MKPFEFINRLKRLQELKRTLPPAVGIIAKGHFQANFKKQGFDNRTVENWQKRKNNKDSGRAILVKSGDLRRSIRVSRADFNRITITSDLHYAKYHNDGTDRLPQRKFIGDSENLIKKIKEKITIEIKNAILGK